jgi:hypothetical protein
MRSPWRSRLGGGLAGEVSKVGGPGAMAWEPPEGWEQRRGGANDLHSTTSREKARPVPRCGSLSGKRW